MRGIWSRCKLRFLLRGVRLMQFLLMVTSHSPLSRSELVHSDRAASTTAARSFCPASPEPGPKPVLAPVPALAPGVEPPCREKCSGTRFRLGWLVGGGGGSGARFGEGSSPS